MSGSVWTGLVHGPLYIRLNNTDNRDVVTSSGWLRLRSVDADRGVDGTTAFRWPSSEKRGQGPPEPTRPSRVTSGPTLLALRATLAASGRRDDRYYPPLGRGKGRKR